MSKGILGIQATNLRRNGSYHGNREDLKPGDLIEPGHVSGRR